MGTFLSMPCPFAAYNDIETGLQSIIVKSVSLGGDDQVKTPERSISFNASDPMILHRSLPSGNMIVEGSISLKQRDLDTLISIVPPPPSSDFVGEDDDKQQCLLYNTPPPSPVADLALASPKHEAAVKLQKVYKSFRTRRKLADCAVLVEQSWWKLIDFAELKHSSISFFDIEQHETAISRWSRAKTRAAKVGKGLSKNSKAQKLALQHWLEAIDPRHRYGHNLHFYYTKWLESQSKEPFFYWLDIGEGRDINLEKCSRCKLHQQCIKYLGPMERKAYEVVVEDGHFFYRESGELLDTSSDPHAKWIFVLSASKSLYVGKKRKGTFQHSSFLAGGTTSAAGRLVVDNGILKAVWPHSGHYKPTPENFQDFIAFLRENHVDITDVKMDPVDEDEHSFVKQGSSLHFRNSSEEYLVTDNVVQNQESDFRSSAMKPDTLLDQENGPDHPSSNQSRRLSSLLTNLQIPIKDDLFHGIQNETQASVLPVKSLNVDDGYDSATESLWSDNDLVDKVEAHEGDEQEMIPAASILQRINSHKEAKSYQLGKQLSCKWTTGAGPRIGCVRDYPSELQFRALEQVNLSPRSQTKSWFSPGCGGEASPKASTPVSIVSRRSIEQCSMHSSPLSKGRQPAVLVVGSN